jgi:hypothetical protein
MIAMGDAIAIVGLVAEAVGEIKEIVDAFRRGQPLPQPKVIKVPEALRSHFFPDHATQGWPKSFPGVGGTLDVAPEAAGVRIEGGGFNVWLDADDGMALARALDQAVGR